MKLSAVLCLVFVLTFQALAVASDPFKAIVTDPFKAKVEPVHPVTPVNPVAPVARTYGDLYREAVKESKPLVVWVGYACPSSANQLPGMLHHFADEWPEVKGPAVIVSIPGNNGKLYFADVLNADQCCAANIKAAVSRGLRASPVSPTVTAHVQGWAASTDGNCAS